MRLFIIFFFITSLFACDTSTNTNAYQNYIKAKQLYIQSILDNSKNQKIKSLNEIIECGNFLGFDVSKYKNRLYALKKHKVAKKVSKQNPLKFESNYLKIISFVPLKFKLSSKMKVKFFVLKRKNNYLKVFDIYNAKINKLIIKRLSNGVLLKIAQNQKNKVRIVLSYKRSFKIRYHTTKQSLKIRFLNTEKLTTIKYRTKKLTKKQKSNKIIVIDPGHGGKDSGGIGQYRIKEKNIVLPLAKYLQRELTKRGYKVYLTRSKDKFITLKNRTKFANRKGADLFLSIHCNIAVNKPKVYGIETYYLSPARSQRAKNVAKLENSAIGNLRSTTQNIVLNFLNKNRIRNSYKFAIDIQQSLIYNLKRKFKHIRDGGVRPAPFWVLVGTKMPAILIETGFISNKKEALQLKNSYYQKEYAKYIANGIDSYFRKHGN